MTDTAKRSDLPLDTALAQDKWVRVMSEYRWHFGNEPMGDVIHRDFGKEEREHARRLAKLLRLVKERDEDMLANPSKYFDMAGKKLADLELFHQRLWEALKLPWSLASREPIYSRHVAPPKMETVTIDRRDYEAYQAVKRLIEARYVADE